VENIAAFATQQLPDDKTFFAIQLETPLGLAPMTQIVQG
jgi:hypothetical protein